MLSLLLALVLMLLLLLLFGDGNYFDPNQHEIFLLSSSKAFDDDGPIHRSALGMSTTGGTAGAHVAV